MIFYYFFFLNSFFHVFVREITLSAAEAKRHATTSLRLSADATDIILYAKADRSTRVIIYVCLSRAESRRLRRDRRQSINGGDRTGRERRTTRRKDRRAGRSRLMCVKVVVRERDEKPPRIIGERIIIVKKKTSHYI